MKKNMIIVFLMTMILALGVATPAFAEESAEGPLTWCGPLEFGCKVQSVFLGWAQSVIDACLSGFKIFIIEPDQIINNGTISNFYDDTTSLFVSLVTVIFIYKLLELLIVGDPESRGSLKEGLVRLVFTFAFAYAFPTFFKWLLTFNNWIVADLLDSGIKFEQFKLTGDDIANTALSLWMLLIFAIIWAILFLILLFQMSIRFAELAFAFAFSPIFIASNLSDNFNMLPSFWRILLSTIFTQTVQISLICIMANMFANANIWEMKTALFAIGFLFLTVKSPNILKEYMYSTGSGKLFGGMGAKGTATLAKELIRRKL